MDRKLDSAAVSFDFFGTLVEVGDPQDPAVRVEKELRARGIPVPNDWKQAYTEVHIDASPGEELSRVQHVQVVLTREGGASNVDNEVIRAAVLAAFDVEICPRDGVSSIVKTVAEQRRVGILSNCSVPGLVPRLLDRSDIERNLFDTVVTSVDCGWRKPHPQAFSVIADALGVPVDELVHVGDDPVSDGGVSKIGAGVIVIEDTPLREVPTLLSKS